jgi:phenylpyruvate tautomerase PptA (4-oxalocrotonate tautomerase family)
VPMMDLYVPAGALSPAAEAKLLERLTDVLLRWEGADPRNERARGLAWLFLHRPATVYVAGVVAARPHYKVVVSVPEGQFDPERRSGMVAAVTQAVLDAEDDAQARDPFRVWVFTREVPDGTWGGEGRIATLADIAGHVLGDLEAGASYAASRLTAARGEASPAPRPT